MRIAFDSQAFCLQKTGGISRYFMKLAQGLVRAKESVGIFAPLHRNIYLKDLDRGIVRGLGVRDYLPKTAGLNVAVNSFISQEMIKKWQPDILHETYFSKSSVLKGLTPTVITVFDMISELEKINFENREFERVEIQKSAKYKAVLRASKVICISEATKIDLLRIYPIPEEKITVIHLGCDKQFNFVATPGSPLSARPYILYVGLRQGYKNFSGLLSAIAQSPRLFKDFDLVAFGGGVFDESELSLIKKLGFKENQVRHLQGSDEILGAAYAQANAFIYPSKYEGFGLPPLEAMSQGCPVVSSNTSSMPEVIGEAGYFFNPSDIADMTQAIEKVVYSEVIKKELILKGHERVKEFTWERCVKRTLATYQSVLHEKRVS